MDNIDPTILQMEILCFSYIEILDQQKRFLYIKTNTKNIQINVESTKVHQRRKDRSIIFTSEDQQTIII